MRGNKIEIFQTQQLEQRFDINNFVKYKESNNCILYIGNYGGEKTVLKVVKKGSRQDREIHYPLSSKAEVCNRIFDCLYRQYFPQVVQTRYFILGKNLAILQQYVDGTALYDLPRYSTSRYDGMKVKEKFERWWPLFLADKRLDFLNKKTKKSFMQPDFSLGNILHVEPDEYYIIDW